MLFPFLLKHIVKTGSLRITTADGRIHDMGVGAPHVAIRLHSKGVAWSLGFNPELKVGEAYAEGLLTIEKGTLAEFLDLLYINYPNATDHPLFRVPKFILGRLAPLRQFNPLERARKNVSYHYDLPDDLYELFLDPDRQYSCAYFTDPRNSLAQAQQDKKRHIAAKLVLDRPGLKVLDIGSGWGGMCLYLARAFGSKTTGVTLSVRQYKASRMRALAEKLDTQCDFKLLDYRLEADTYDRIVSVGMFEHVGRKNYDEFFARLRTLLNDDGICLLHTISHFDAPHPVNPFIHKHIFPGADVPALSEILEPLQRSGLFVTDIEILRLHYAETLKHWARNFEAHRDKITGLYGEFFYRKWFFYLISCEMAFRHGFMMVAQLQISKRLEAVPLTRDYIYEEEQQPARQMKAS